MDNILTLFIGNMTKEIMAFNDSYIAEGLDLDQLQIIKRLDAPDIFTFFDIRTVPTVIFFSNTEEQMRLLHLPTIQEVKSFLNRV